MGVRFAFRLPAPYPVRMRHPELVGELLGWRVPIDEFRLFRSVVAPTLHQIPRGSTLAVRQAVVDTRPELSIRIAPDGNRHVGLREEADGGSRPPSAEDAGAVDRHADPDERRGDALAGFLAPVRRVLIAYRSRRISLARGENHSRTGA